MDKKDENEGETEVLLRNRIPSKLVGKIHKLAKETDRQPNDMIRHLLKIGVERVEALRAEK